MTTHNDVIIGCGSHECHIVGKNTGQCTNSTCNCLSPLTTANSLALRRRLAFLERALDLACGQVRLLRLDSCIDCHDCGSCDPAYFLKEAKLPR